jgi:hypothetical protein
MALDKIVFRHGYTTGCPACRPVDECKSVPDRFVPDSLIRVANPGSMGKVLSLPFMALDFSFSADMTSFLKS